MPPDICTLVPVAVTPPSGINARCQTAFALVIATYSTVSSRFVTTPFGLTPVVSRQSRRPAALSRYTFPVGS